VLYATQLGLTRIPSLGLGSLSDELSPIRKLARCRSFSSREADHRELI